MIIEVPHFASLRGKQREIIVLRSDNGETWKEHTLEANEEAVQEVLNQSFDGEGVLTFTIFLKCFFLELFCRVEPTRRFAHKSNNANIDERFSALFCCCLSDQAGSARDWP